MWRLANNGTCGLRTGSGRADSPNQNAKDFNFSLSLAASCIGSVSRTKATISGQLPPATGAASIRIDAVICQVSFCVFGYQSRQRQETTSSVTIRLFGSLPKWSFTVCKWIGWRGSASLYGSFRSHANFPSPGFAVRMGFSAAGNTAAVKQPNDS